MSITIYHMDINGTIIGTDSTDERATLTNAVMESISRSIDIHGNILTSDKLNAKEKSYYHWLKQNNKYGYKLDAYNVLNVFPQYQQYQSELEKIFSNGLFPSFVKLLKNRILVTDNNVLVFRTFGKDRHYIMDLINSITPMTFITCTADDLSLKLYQQCIENNTHIFIQDSFTHWNRNGKSITHGKLITEYPGTIQFGFDDNDCMYGVGNNITIFKVNTLEASLNQDYYLSLINQAEQIYS